MNKFFISGLRKEANPAVAGLATGAHKFKPSFAQAADYSNPGQPAAWEKPLYALQRGVAKLPVSVQKALNVVGGGVMGMPNPFGGIDNKPKSQKMFDPKDNPEQYHRDVYNMAVARDNRQKQIMSNNWKRMEALRRELRDNPSRSIKLGPYMNRAKHMFDMSALAPSDSAWWVGKPGSVNAMNFIDNIKYGNPAIGQYADKYRY